MNKPKELIWILLTCIAGIAAGQSTKLPKIQDRSIRAPGKVQINGHLNEWGDLAAYNKGNHIYYTIANDDKDLYLVIRTSDADMIDKIVRGGVTLSFNEKAKKKDQQLPAITFPFYMNGDHWFPFQLDDRTNNEKAAGIAFKPDDEFLKRKDQFLTEHFKWIGILGIKSIPDSVISVYNEDGVKAAATLNKDLSLGYEMSVPLKLLGLNPNSILKLYYNICLNGAGYYSVKVFEARPGLLLMQDANGKSTSYGTDIHAADKIFPTDFWGEYTLSH